MSQGSANSENEKPWMLYMIECADGSFYTGVTNDIERRLAEHNEGLASRYTRSRRPVKLRYHEICRDRNHALVRECAVKLLSRREKEALLARASPTGAPSAER